MTWQKKSSEKKGKINSKRKTKNLFQISQNHDFIGDMLHVHLMKRDWVVIERQPTLH